MAQDDTALDAQALDWIVRTGDPAFDDWPDFMAWMEADPAHATRYHALSAAIDDGVASLRALQAGAVAPSIAKPARRAPQRIGRWAGGAIAASLAVVAGLSVYERRPQPYAVEAAPGAARTILLAEGSRIMLAGGSCVTIDRRDARIATLDRGEAMFVVAHDAADPFEVLVGETRLVDVGTAFDVKRTSDGMRVSVSEGAVDYDPGPNAIRMTAGQGVVVARGGVMRITVDAAAVGSWREGRLAFENTPMTEVAEDLSRTLGIAIAVAPDVAERRVRATIATAGLARDPTPLAALLDVTMRRSAQGWTMSAR